jgi:tetratricopeptide (TPR) repeat protein
MAGIDFDYDTAIARGQTNLDTGIAYILKSAAPCADEKRAEYLEKAVEIFSKNINVNNKNINKNDKKEDENKNNNKDEFAEAKLWRAYAYYRQGNYERALADIAAAANKTEAHSELQGLIYSKLKQQEQTLSSYREALKSQGEPALLDTYLNLAQKYYNDV